MTGHGAHIWLSVPLVSRRLRLVLSNQARPRAIGAPDKRFGPWAESRPIKKIVVRVTFVMFVALGICPRWTIASDGPGYRL